MGSAAWLSPFRDKAARRWGLGLGLVYLVFYLYSIGHLLFAPGEDLAFGRPVPSASVVSDWGAKMWKPIAPFVWEPIAAVYPFRSVALFLSVPNLLLGALLGILVGLNLMAALARVRLVAGAGFKGGSLRGLAASLPALLTGFTCCVPTVILALGSLAAGFAVAAIAVTPYLLPAAAIALALNLLWSFRQYQSACAVRFPPRARD